MDIEVYAVWPHLTCLGLAGPLLSSSNAFDYFGALGGLFSLLLMDLLLTSVLSELIARQWGVIGGGMAKRYCRKGQYPQQVRGWHGVLFLFDIQKVLKLKLPSNGLVLGIFSSVVSQGQPFFA